MAEISGIQSIVPKPNSQSMGQVRSDAQTPDISTPVVDPSRIVRANDQEVNTGTEAYKYGRDSNFENFVRILQSMPELSDLYNDVFMTKLSNQVNIATYGKDFAAEVFKFMEAINMSPEDVLTLIKDQNLLTNKFTGPFFDIIRNMISNGSSRELTMAVLDFLKRYDAYTSTPHTENVLLSNLKGIAANIPRTYSNQLVEVMEKYPSDGTQAEKMQFLKNEVLPFLTKYVSQTHDYGIARDMIAMFTVGLGKYETGSAESFAESFKNLSGYLQIMGMLDGVDVAVLRERLMDTDGGKDTKILDAFIRILSEGLSGKTGASNKASFQEMISALLVNESVYMPLNHMVIPANIDGRMLFSEMWVDPDADNLIGEASDENKASKIFVKFIIQELGNFDLLLVERSGKVNLELHYPETFPNTSQEIRRDISEIVRNNNLTLDNMTVAKGKTEKNLIQIFPKIFTQKTSVDVSV